MKTSLNYISVWLLICFMGFSIFPSQIAIAKAESVQYTQSVPVTLGDSSEDSYSRVAVHSALNTAGYYTVDGNVPGRFTSVGYLNNTLTGYSVQDEALYPKFLGGSGYMTPNLVDNNWDSTDWWVFDNTTTTPNKTGSFNIHYTTEVIGNLPEGTRKDFYAAYPNQYYIALELSIDKEGVYVLYIDHAAIYTLYTFLISPDNIQLATIPGSLPDATPTGNDPLQDYWTFIVPDRGVYKFYFAPLRNHFTAQLEEFSTLKKVTFKEDPVYLSYRDESSAEIYPAKYIDDFPIYVYSIEVKKGDYIHYDLDYLWGESANPNAQIVVPNGKRYSNFTIDPDDPLEFQFMSFSGTVYIIIIHQNYFSWSGQAPARNLLAYNLRLEKVTPVDLDIGNIDELRVPAVPGHLLVRLIITTPQLILFNRSSIGTSPTFTLSGSPFFFIHETYGKTGISSLANTNSYYVFYFAADTYYTIIEYAGNGIDAQLLLLESHSSSLGTPLNHVSRTKLSSAVFDSNKSIITFPFFNNGTGSGALIAPLIFPYTRDSIYNLGYNLTFHREDNPELSNDNPIRFRFKGRFYEVSPYDGRTLISTNSYDSSQITLNANVNRTNPSTRTAQIDGASISRRAGNGFLMIWPYNVQFDNGSGGFVHYNKSLTFRIATTDQYKYLSRISMPTIAPHTMELEPSVNYTAVPYGLTNILNLTKYDGLWIDISAQQDYDWWQFILASNLTGAGELSWSLLFDNQWIGTSFLAHSNLEPLISDTDEANNSAELGLPVREFSLVLFIDDSTETVELKMYLSEFNVRILMSPPITAKFVLTFSDWGPWLGVGVGGAAILTVAAIIIVRKRRHWK